MVGILEGIAMIVWLSSYPRSGNTLLRSAIHQIHGVNTRDVYYPQADPDWPPEMLEAADRVGFEELTSLDQLAESDEIAFIKTHELPSDNHPAIYVVRDGRDALTSYSHFILTTERGYTADDRYSDEYQREFLSTLYDLAVLNQSFGGWSNHVLKWSCRQATTVLIRFEDLLHSPVRTLELATQRLSLDGKLPRGSETFSAETSRLSSPLHFRRGKVGSFRQEMTRDIEQIFWSHHGRVMELMGYRDRLTNRPGEGFNRFWQRFQSKAA